EFCIKKSTSLVSHNNACSLLRTTDRVPPVLEPVRRSLLVTAALCPSSPSRYARTMPRIVNIAGYQFTPLTELPTLREQLLTQCKACELKGTILISPEGINLFVAGGGPQIDSLLEKLRAIDGLASFSPKVSISDDQPFNRMLVKIKKEIIAFGVPGIEPARRTSPKLPPRELKRWLDEGRPVKLLDTRNDYEVKLGTFKNAVTLGIDHFRNLPAAVGQLPAELKQQPVVMFCTGGIRCEKAGPYMEREGFQNVFQLEGGILKYFEECGGDHYDGECFVFDKRIGLDAGLAETENAQCFNCQAPLSLDEQRDPRYVFGESCPHCYLSVEARIARTIAERQAAIARAITPLPGSEPYDNFRPLRISVKHDGQTLLNMLCIVFPQLPCEHWLDRFNQHLLLDRDRRPVAPEQLIRAGELYLHRMPATSEPEVNASIHILHEDEAIVVVDKPAPLPLHPSGRFNRNTLQAILNTVYHPQKLRPMHRLDANTTGVVVFARTRRFAGRLQPQFAAGQIEKLYLARVQGHPAEHEFICNAPIGNMAIALGGRAIDGHGSLACTEFRVLHKFSDGTSLVEASPITGRTNQIRVHLSHLGWPVVGDQAYLQNQQLGDTQTHAITDPPLCLHSQRIAFTHPLTGERIAFESPSPPWTSS
ncbi:MAG TPA: sulfurtransferase, partial [Lacipirellulaceae bacterium]|nr:sulfurtransferase [Lacipirellulaceae bacterium]